MFVPHRSLFEKGSIFDIGGFGLVVEWKEDVCMDGFTLWSVGYTLYNIQPSFGIVSRPPTMRPPLPSGQDLGRRYSQEISPPQWVESCTAELLLLSSSTVFFVETSYV